MLADRHAAIEGFGKPLKDGIALEAELGRQSLEVGACAGRHALRRAAHGRHGEGVSSPPD